jgi:hypothetical protein
MTTTQKNPFAAGDSFDLDAQHQLAKADRHRAIAAAIAAGFTRDQAVLLVKNAKAAPTGQYCFDKNSPNPFAAASRNYTLQAILEIQQPELALHLRQSAQ